MIDKNKILIFLSSCGVLFLTAAGFLFDWGWISAGSYFKFYAVGILAWAMRMRMQSIGTADALLLNIIMWLCIFNVMDEFLSATPWKPYKPWIATIVIISTTLYIHFRKCRNNRNSSKS